MTTTRRQRFVTRQLAWMVGTILCLAIIGALTIELFVVASLVGLMLLTVATAPVNLTPQWRRRLKWPIFLGLVLFTYFVVNEFVEVTQSLF
ncbi:hypothetical protein ACFQGE_11665 [Halomicroarcula sp. GCM10025817]|uniref:hypothetical protein n=1 Tax=Haloarcula TaxID=2237 RepID=UPI0023E8E116|nr:hypothetical protein [Halomicroarcula sp. SYNS111]